ncbi:cytochrome b/b6 domain-containing protein [Parashewanella hymeniacidonis]|uniref:cytochrome b/b6 domain-containing protein n=1 Tax=Parashewanella hymeniacidonis TaxID=2807618 RepID=UPI00308418B9
MHNVWDLPRRIFHWLNVFFVFTLIALGLLMMNKSALGITGTEAKVGLKTLHVLIGYGFCINLLLRISWGLIGPKHPKLSLKRTSLSELSNYQTRISKGHKPQYLGHTPLGRVSVMLMFILLGVIMITGLVRAGTDIYYPPFGSTVQAFIAEHGELPSKIKPYNDTYVDPSAKLQLGPFKSLMGNVHRYSVYLLMFILIMHIWAVVKTEVTLHPGLISAMVSGKKIIEGKAEDE